MSNPRLRVGDRVRMDPAMIPRSLSRRRWFAAELLRRRVYRVEGFWKAKCRRIVRLRSLDVPRIGFYANPEWLTRDADG